PALGAYFDGIARMLDDPNYKAKKIAEWDAQREERRNRARRGSSVERFREAKANADERNLSGEERWNRKVARDTEWLERAEELGWIDPQKASPKIRAVATIPPENFLALVNLAEEHMGLTGPTGQLQAWVDNFSQRVSNAETVLLTQTRKAGIWQMAPSASNKSAG